MDYQSINTLFWIAFYATHATWPVLFTVLFIALFKRKWNLLKRASKYLLNTSVLIFAWAFYMELALIVKAPIRKTKEASSIALKSWIKEHQTTDIYIALIVVLVLSAINLLFYFRVENKRHQEDLLILAIFDVFILTVSIWLMGQSAYVGLMQEINRRFG